MISVNHGMADANSQQDIMMISSAVDSTDLQESSFGVIQQMIFEFGVIEQMLIAICERLSAFASIKFESLNDGESFDERIERLTSLVVVVRNRKLPAFDSSNMLKLLFDSLTNVQVLKLRLDRTIERLRESEAPEAQNIMDLRLLSAAIRKQAEDIYFISNQMNDIDKTVADMLRALGRKCLSMFSIFQETGRN